MLDWTYSTYKKRFLLIQFTQNEQGRVRCKILVYIYIYIYIPTYSTYMLLLYTHNYGTGVTRVHTRGCHFQPTPDLHGVVRFQCT